MKNFLLAAAALLLIAAAPVKENESLAFFPSYGVQASGGGWRVKVHAWVYEPELHSPARNAFIGAIKAALPAGLRESPLLGERLRPFLRDSHRGRELPLRIGGAEFLLPPTMPGGHVRAEVPLPSTTAGRADFSVGPFGHDSRVFRGSAVLVPPEGLSIISDIDDTVKLSDVRDRRRLLSRTFVEPFVPVEGMARLYGQWSEEGAVFHYVSASPWQLGEALADFLSREGFPAGTFHLKDFRIAGQALLDLFAAPDAHKNQVIEELFRDFPRRRFILIGDDGERDPEIYARAAREHPGQVGRILIRLAYGRGDEARFDEAFKGLPRGLWDVFKDPKDIRP